MAERRARQRPAPAPADRYRARTLGQRTRDRERQLCSEPRPACRGSDRCTQTRAPSRMWWWSRNRFANPDARCASGPCAVTVRALDADTSSVASGAAARDSSEPPAQLAAEVEHAEVQPGGRFNEDFEAGAGHDFTTAKVRLKPDYYVEMDEPRFHHKGRRGAANALNEQRHRLEFPRTGRLVDDDLQPLDLAEKELARQKVDTRRVDCRQPARRARLKPTNSRLIWRCTVRVSIRDRGGVLSIAVTSSSRHEHASARTTPRTACAGTV